MLTTGVSPAGGGAVGTTPSSADGYYNSGTSVQLSAFANFGYAFTTWSGDVTASTNPVLLVMSRPNNVVGNFNIAVPPRFVTDFNGDGKTDLVWQHMGSGQLATWLMDGTTLIASPFFNPEQCCGGFDFSWKIVGTGDFNADGKTDLVFFGYQLDGSWSRRLQWGR